MEQIINWACCPEATHYLTKSLASNFPASFWCISADGRLITRWDHEGKFISNSDLYLNESARMRLIARPVADWAVAPSEATHYVTSGRERIPSGWYRVEGVKMRCLHMEGEYMFRLDDVTHGPSDLLLEVRPPVAPNWGKAPAGTTHFLPNGMYGDRYIPCTWFRNEIDGSFSRAYWENDWYWVEAPLSAIPVSSLIQNPDLPGDDPVGAPDWDVAPADAEFWGPATSDGKYHEGWFKHVTSEVGGGIWLRAEKGVIGDWVWHDWGVFMKRERREMLLPRPKDIEDWDSAPADATHLWNGNRFYKFDMEAETAYLLKWGEWEQVPFESYRNDMSGMMPRPERHVAIDMAAHPGSDMTVSAHILDGEVIAVWPNDLPPVGDPVEVRYAEEQYSKWHPATCVAVGIDADDKGFDVCVTKGEDGKIAVYHCRDHIRPRKVEPIKGEPGGAEEWNGEGKPPQWALCWVTPHNTVWGFETLETLWVKVVAVCADYVWLGVLNEDGSAAGKFITTRWDKVDFVPFSLEEMERRLKRMDAVRVWLDEIERDYDAETRQKAEEILMQAEEKLRVKK